MNPIQLIRSFIRVSVQQELAYRTNFYINLIYSLISLIVGVLGLSVLFNQVNSILGWTFSQTLALLGVYLTVGALRNLFIGPSLEKLAGLGQEISTGNFDFVLLKPLNTQFYVTFRSWRIYSLIDLALGAGVIGLAVSQSSAPVSLLNLLTFFISLCAGVVVLYSLLLAFTALVFWSPGFLFTWVFDSLFQLARYPVGIYPAWLRIILTWIIPVGIITTIPAQALSGTAPLAVILISMGAAGFLFLAASWFFRFGLRRYASASS
jgi:ABC-2 type transport system permease protein